MIEDFHPHDANELILMWRASFERALGIVDPHPLNEQEQYLLQQVVPHNTIIVARLDGEIVGFCAASTESIAQLYVHVDFQRQGIGTKLLDWAKSQSNGSLWLYTFQKNAAARAFYEHNDFRVIERGFEPEWQLDDLKYEWKHKV